ncbi:MAG: NAD(P)-binding domain-containing protein, partial [Deltaproteobacteria bacterium]|nr:NAD(P)-binding domain-containing protein [Deltaproteobacteria bacterium]
MTLVVPAVLGGLAIVVMALVSMAASRRQREASSEPAYMPAILVHAINDDRCTGCDACVAVCPTNVLDLVDNKSRVLRFQDCIQCEACMWACPTEALVMFKEGTDPPPLTMPELDEFYQTAVPGQYLIGEVAGKPLVKNAANLGRAVVEHMLAGGLRSSGNYGNMVDVAIVGSGPGGLSAALTCIERGLSYVVLEKEQIIASTIARYPKGKLVMAEPYDSRNLSLLPVFDSSKEELLPIWTELIDRTGLAINLGEAVEEVQHLGEGFGIRTTVGQYQAQRVVLATGTRGKPRTLGVSGENLPKVCSLLEDPDEHRGRAVLVVGGGDSALEATIALADAGAKVILSYRGRSFARAQPKLKNTVEGYDQQRRIKIKYQSVVTEFDDATVTLQMADGSLKKYPNEAAFVLIGSEPPVKWLRKVGVNFVQRPHSYALPKSDDLVSRLIGNRSRDCPETAAHAAALVQGREVPIESKTGGGRKSGRKWLRSATSLFTTKGRKLDKPMPLGEFARSNRLHTGTGRRDQLPASERTRVLRMLRDEGARLADEESSVELSTFRPPTGQVEWADDARQY